jgi:hypothetical protein
MDVGREAVGFVERADANEANCVTGSGVVAPKRDSDTWHSVRFSGPLLRSALCALRSADVYLMTLSALELAPR